MEEYEVQENVQMISEVEVDSQEQLAGRILQIIPGDSVVTLPEGLSPNDIQILADGEFISDGQIQVYNTIPNAESIQSETEKIKFLEEKIHGMSQRDEEQSAELAKQESMKEEIGTLTNRVQAMESIIVDLISKSNAVPMSTLSKLRSVGILPSSTNVTVDEGQMLGQESVYEESTDPSHETDVVNDHTSENNSPICDTPDLNERAQDGTSTSNYAGKITPASKAPSGRGPSSSDFLHCEECDFQCKRFSTIERHMEYKHGKKSSEGSPSKNKPTQPDVVTKSGRRIKRKRMFDYETNIKEEPEDMDDFVQYSPTRSAGPAVSSANDKDNPKIVWVVYRNGKFEVPEKVTISDKEGNVKVTEKCIDENPPDNADDSPPDTDNQPDTETQAPTSESIKMFLCANDCSETFYSIEELREHRKTDHKGDKRWHCSKCCVFFPTNADKVRHSRKCGALKGGKAKGPFICDVCGKVKGSVKELRDHMRMHKQEKKGAVESKVKREKEPCPVCGKMFDIYGMKKHMSSHDKPILCDTCGKGFPSQDSLCNHKLREHEDITQAKYKCDVCGMVFISLNQCKAHMSVHKEVRDVVCEYCNKTFPCARYLWTHMKVKHLEKKFNCQLCDKKFGLKTQLNIHINTIHMKMRKYRCRKCNVEFAEHSALTEHKNKMHAGEIAYQCLLCMKGFQRRYRYRTHLLQVHNVESSIQDDGQMVIHGQESLIQKLDMDNMTVVTETYETVQ